MALVADDSGQLGAGLKKLLLMLIGIFPAVVLSGCGSTVTVIPGGDVYWQDDFSDPASGWDQANGTDGVTDYAGGVYRMFSALPDYYLWANPGKQFASDVRIEVEVVKTTGPDDSVFGIVCRYRNTDNYYVLMISGEGLAGIAKLQSGQGLTLISGESLAADANILKGLATNRLRADCIGDSLTLFVNDAQVASAADSALSGGDVGLFLGAFDMPGADVYFDNFTVRRP
jgi:hypothetical protein